MTSFITIILCLVLICYCVDGRGNQITRLLAHLTANWPSTNFDCNLQLIAIANVIRSFDSFFLSIEYRTHSGLGNNVANPSYGTPNSALRR
jgi:hypothetical protein